MSKKATKPDKKQGKLTSFFKQSPKKATHRDKKTASDAEVDVDVDEDEGEGEDVEIDDETVSKIKGLDTSLPPIHDIQAIFSDLVKRIPEVGDVAEHVAGRKLRVATMCSGTESPLLALEMIQNAIKEHYNQELDVEHVFSCEIEPFKQAYIERNFRPPILFRDVCELGDDNAHTAYGALVPVPGNVDLLVAGTSCVDYSNLNTQKKGINSGGESGRTFHGMLSWVSRHRPPLVILENVCSAPWTGVVSYFEKQGYSAEFCRFDTKNFYIPHTRTRVYLIAVNKENSSIAEKWKKMVKERLPRKASSDLDAFLLPTDDPRIHQARQKLVKENLESANRRGRTDWTRCQSRHEFARVEEQLGSRRPLTGWEEGGTCKLPDFAWNNWGISQVERVWDLMDISLLRSALKGVDPSFKTHVWNLSQNVDRSTGTNLAGICPCLTPSMIPYITNRGGPMIGLEALSMQGLPIEKLLLTRESEDQLADLAGNAMSTTVVGACILAAFVSGKKLLKAGQDHQSYEAKHAEHEGEKYDEMEVDNPVALESVVSNPDERITGEDELSHRAIDLSATGGSSLVNLLRDAERSARLCPCEGRVDITKDPLNYCKACQGTFCQKCGGRPEHEPERMDPRNNTRLAPTDFAKELKLHLPMCVSLQGVDQGLLDTLKDDSAIDISKKIWSKWCEAVLRGSQSELRFVELKRQEIWSAVYESPSASLELFLHPQHPEWRFFAKALDSEAANAQIREILQQPIGRLVCGDGILSGSWDFALPYHDELSVTVEGTGEKVPSWENRLGLLKSGDATVFSSLKITVAADDAKKLDRDISGEYVYLPKCGTANGSLLKRLAKENEENLPTIFLFMDPHRINNANDSFVFSISKRRYEYGESRPLLCALESKWRPSSTEGPQNVTCELPFRWARTVQAKLLSPNDQTAQFGLPTQSLTISSSKEACGTAKAMLVASVPLRGQVGSLWPKDSFDDVDAIQERSVFRGLAWLLERAQHVEGKFSNWNLVSETHDNAICERCAPSPPEVEWRVTQGGKGNSMVPVENSVQAGEYERSLKSRPKPFVTQLKVDDSGVGHVRVGLNVPSLIHRAASLLPKRADVSSATLSWRLDTNFTPAVTLKLRKFTIGSNKTDPQHSQPPNFKTKLRIEQLRSLDWMVKQESKTAQPFTEEEVTEACLLPLGWRAEGRASREVHVRGGVLADQVGYGKTAVTLGLMDVTQDRIDKVFAGRKTIRGKVLSAATVVVVPPHLTRQWGSEAEKFAGKRFKKVIISSMTNLNSLTIEKVVHADLIVVASNIFKSDTYLTNLANLAGVADLPNKDGRHFDTKLEKLLENLKDRVELLRKEGSAALMEEVRAGQERAKEEAEAAAAAAEQAAQSKRLKGKSYAERAKKVDEAKSIKAKAKEGGATDARPANEEPRSGLAKPTRNGLIPEVVISRRSSSTKSSTSKSGATSRSPSVTSSPPTTPAPEDSDSDTSRPRQRRAAAKRVVIDSDEEDDEESSARDSRKPRKQSKKKSKPSSSGRSSDSDYEDGSPEEMNSESEMVSASDEESDSKAKSKRPAKSKARSETPKSSSESDMDVDEPVSNGKKKRKSTGKDERPAKKQKRVDADPWKLGSKPVKEEWTQMQAVSFEMFHFARVVVDEYTYLDGKVHSLVTHQTSDRKWVLSGTPPVGDFAAVKTISAFLGIHLGIDDDGENDSPEAKKRNKDLTAVEKFHFFRESHTLEWHASRHAVAQRFLDQFVRQNIAEIDEIPWTDHDIDVVLPAAEKAIYLELEHHLRALDMTIKKGKSKNESDRERRLAQSLGESKSAEEALIKRCSHFDLDITSAKGSSAENAMKSCEVIVKERERQLEDCKKDLVAALKDAVKREKQLSSIMTDSHFNTYVSHIRNNDGVDDLEAQKVVLALFEEAAVGPPKPNRKYDGELSKTQKDNLWEHREKTHDIRRLTKELCGRLRSLRYFIAVRDLQKEGENHKIVSCPRCKKECSLEEVGLLSSCGHKGCLSCVRRCASDHQICVDETCKYPAGTNNIVEAKTLGFDDETRDGKGRHFGKKLEKVMELIKSKTKDDDRVLVFVQFADLIEKVAEAFTYNKIKFLQIKGSAHQKSKNLETFQNNGDEKVLLLNVMDESASGANLTNANHAVFLSPLLAPTKEIYDANETQAIGRVKRYGQEKHVHIWRFVTKDTIDEETYKKRRETETKAKEEEERDRAEMEVDQR